MRPIVTLSKEYEFAAAHRLPRTPPNHKCHRLHGHTYRVVLELRGPVSENTGMLVDFEAISAAWAPLYQLLDHRLLNDVPGLANPTAELIALWIMDQLHGAGPTALEHLVTVRVYEGRTSCAVAHRDCTATPTLEVHHDPPRAR